MKRNTDLIFLDSLWRLTCDEAPGVTPTEGPSEVAKRADACSGSWWQEGANQGTKKLASGDQSGLAEENTSPVQCVQEGREVAVSALWGLRVPDPARWQLNQVETVVSFIATATVTSPSAAQMGA